MCAYVNKIEEVMMSFEAARKGSFDMLDLRDKIREIVPNEDVRYREVKHEALAAFERGMMPNYVLDTRKVEGQDSPKFFFRRTRRKVQF